MNNQFFVNLRHFLSYWLCGLLFFGALSLPAAAAETRGGADTSPSETSEANAVAIGHVNFLLGRAYVEAPSESRESLRVDSALRVGDLITTGTNGHVHIEFDDGAYVSVRPNSRLEIVNYDFNADRPELSSVKFNLQEGVTRAISGQAAKSAREQFRLNTPIAAIGVRGTDFVVSATDTTVRALVNEGVIVMAPFSAECRADGIGPCGANSVELAGQSMQILQQDGFAALPQLLPEPVNTEVSTFSNEAVIARVDATPAEGTDKKAANETFLDVVVLSNATAETDDIVVAVAPTPPPTAPDVTPTVPDTIPTAPSTTPTVPDTTPTVPDTTPTTPPVTVPQTPTVTVPDLTPTVPVTAVAVRTQQLVWGRYATTAHPSDVMTLSFAEAAEDRKVTVGNFEVALFRDESALQRVDRGLGVVSFQLNSAQAQYDSANGVVAMQVSDGALAIDFQESTFATELNLNHALTGPVDFVAAGRLFDGGYFHNRTESQRIAGAVSFDGTEAGYFFERQLESGNIKGLTLWGSQ